MGNVNETAGETNSTTINKAIRAFESKKEDERKTPIAVRPKVTVNIWAVGSKLISSPEP